MKYKMSLVIIPILDLIKYKVNKYIVSEDTYSTNLLMLVLSGFISLLSIYLLNFDIYRVKIFILSSYYKIKLMFMELPNNSLDITYEEYMAFLYESMYEYENETSRNENYRNGIYNVLRKIPCRNRIQIEGECKIIKEAIREAINKSIASEYALKSPSERASTYTILSTKDNPAIETRLSINDGALCIPFFRFNKYSYVYVQYGECHNYWFYTPDILVVQDIMIPEIFRKYRSKNIAVDSSKLYIDISLSKDRRYKKLIEPNLTFDYLFFPEKLNIIRLLEDYKKHQLFNGLMYNNLGVLLYGLPGTGKTSLIYAIANYLNKNVYSIDYKGLKTISDFMEEVTKHKEEIIVFDEFDFMLEEFTKNDDSLFMISLLEQSLKNEKLTKEERSEIMSKIERISMEHKYKLSFSFFLQWFDGLYSSSNRIIIATTNNIDKIDSRLIRPGRFSVKLCFEKMERKCVKELLEYIFKTKIDKKITIPDKPCIASEIIVKSIEYGNLKDTLKYLNAL